jgi:hypothetical protein
MGQLLFEEKASPQGVGRTFNRDGLDQAKQGLLFAADDLVGDTIRRAPPAAGSSATQDGEAQQYTQWYGDSSVHESGGFGKAKGIR